MLGRDNAADVMPGAVTSLACLELLRGSMPSTGLELSTCFGSVLVSELKRSQVLSWQHSSSKRANPRRYSVTVAAGEAVGTELEAAGCLSDREMSASCWVHRRQTSSHLCTH